MNLELFQTVFTLRQLVNFISLQTFTDSNGNLVDFLKCGFCITRCLRMELEWFLKVSSEIIFIFLLSKTHFIEAVSNEFVKIGKHLKTIKD